MANDNEANEKRRTRSVEETAEILGVGRSAMYEAVRNGQVEAFKIGQRWLIPLVVINRLTGEVEE